MRKSVLLLLELDSRIVGVDCHVTAIRSNGGRLNVLIRIIRVNCNGRATDAIRALIRIRLCSWNSADLYLGCLGKCESRNRQRHRVSVDSQCNASNQFSFALKISDPGLKFSHPNS